MKKDYEKFYNSYKYFKGLFETRTKEYLNANLLDWQHVELIEFNLEYIMFVLTNYGEVTHIEDEELRLNIDILLQPKDKWDEYILKIRRTIIENQQRKEWENNLINNSDYDSIYVTAICSLRDKFDKFIQNQKDIPKEYVDIINDHFWDMIG